MMAEYEAQGLKDKAIAREWDKYVRKHLLPRLNGFELMIAPYIVSHLRLGLALQQTGFTFKKDHRLRVFLTNTLDQHTSAQIALISPHIATEAAAAVNWTSIVAERQNAPPDISRSTTASRS